MSPEARIAFLILVFGAVFSAAQAIIGMAKAGNARRKVNRRLATAERIQSVGDLVVELRKQRGLNASGDRWTRWVWLADLIVQSGLVYQPRRWLAALILLCAALGAPAFMITQSLVAVLFAPPAAAGIAVLFLKFVGARRAKALGEQLPTALDLVVRSLEAGHPVPAALALVGKEMPEPIGSEFGMAADEIAYGANLEQAVGRMADRCRHPDIDLFAATVRLQERAGGNLTSLLRLNARTVRDRHKMRLRIRAASSEGRASAMILTSAPFVVAGILALASPGYYADVIGEPVVQYWLAGFGGWMLVGNAVMRRMINMRI
jgi:tight adherence protein B